MKGLNRFLFLFLAILVCGIAVSEAVFRASWLWMIMESGRTPLALSPVALAIGSILATLVGIAGLWISIRRGANRAIWAFLGLLIAFPILGVVLPT